MKKLFMLISLPLLAACAQTAPSIEGEIVGYQTTYDQHSQNPRPRWILALDPPLTITGTNGQAFAQVKVFDLADTVQFRAGTRLAFRYREVPSAQQTPWLTSFERSAVPSFPPGYKTYPELQLIGIKRL